MGLWIQTTSYIYNSRRDCSTSNSSRYTTAIVLKPDYVSLSSSSSSSVFSLPLTCYMVADPGYDDKKLYEYSKNTLGIDLVCPVEKYKNPPKRDSRLCVFMNQH